MDKPKHGYILHYLNKNYFRHIKNSNDPYTHLPDFESNAHELINNKHLFKSLQITNSRPQKYGMPHTSKNMTACTNYQYG